ncbi:MAG: YhcB family protein [Pseudomonadales bacterium]|nr:YhcB family protein [Pseudomonadales bacterium]NNL10820.1 YhcB family protein [Pseudomonadales bacterium]
MYELEVVIFVGIAAAVSGLLLGAGLHRSVGSSSAKVRKLKQALEQAKAQNRDYQSDVAEHFSQTAEMLNGLTRQYKSIHDHLAGGAEKLCRDPAGHTLLAGGGPVQLSIEERRNDAEMRAKHEEANLQPPLDYAPKTETRSGTLSEEYGLEKVKLAEAPEPADATNPADTKPPEPPAAKLSSA